MIGMGSLRTSKSVLHSLVLLGVGLMVLTTPVGTLVAQEKSIQFKYQPAPADHPLKGFVPYAGSNNQSFSHSMEWASFPLNKLMTGSDSFLFDRGFEPILQAVSKRGHQLAMRVYLDNPKSKSGIPQFLLDAGLKTRNYKEHGG